jgi:hypothetical protein
VKNAAEHYERLVGCSEEDCATRVHPAPQAGSMEVSSNQPPAWERDAPQDYPESRLSTPRFCLLEVQADGLEQTDSACHC